MFTNCKIIVFSAGKVRSNTMKVFKYLSGLNLFLVISLLLIITQPLSAFDFDDILFWVGEGDNQAALVIDWQDGKEPQSLAWGFRWSGTATGQDLINAIVSADNRLSGNVDGIISSLIYDLDNNQIIDDNDHNINYSLYPNNYWSYWVKENSNQDWGYSNHGISGRYLTDGCWDAWVFIEDWMMEHPEPTTPVAAEPETNNDFIAFSDILYWIGEGQNQAMLVIDWKDDSVNPSLAWGYRWNGTKSAYDMISEISATDPRLSANLGSGFLNDLVFTVDGEIINEGLAGEPDWWGTWSRTLESAWAMNSGIVTVLDNNDIFGCSYGFTPAPTEPDNPVPVEEIENETEIIANSVNYTLRTGLIHHLYVTKNDIFDSEITIEIVNSPEELNIYVDSMQYIVIETASNIIGEFTVNYRLIAENTLSNIAEITIELFEGFTGSASDDDTEAISNNDERIIAWATSVEIQRGYVDIRNPELGYASYGEPENAIGQAMGNSLDVVSLGDGGNATITFENPIINGEGADFVVFENGISDYSLELAFVEVSSDGVTFVRFPAVSLSQNEVQTGNADPTNPRDLYNLAGKYRAGYGTPFDLQDLADSSNVNINYITHVRIVDVVGSINPEFASYDSNGNIINDPFPTAFASSGFDLDGVGVIHQLTTNETDMITEAKPFELHSAYPNPFNPQTTISFTINQSNQIKLEIFNIKGQRVKSLADGVFEKGTHNIVWNGTNDFNEPVGSGVYFYRIMNGSVNEIKKVMLIK